MAKGTQRLPGTEKVKPYADEVQDQVEELVKFRDSRMEAGRLETEAERQLVKLMEKHKLKVVQAEDGRPMELSSTLKKKVLMKKAPKATDGDKD